MNVRTPKMGRYTLAVRGKDKDDIYFLMGRNIVFTGRGPYTRNKLMEFARKAGGKITSNTITKETNLLVVGEAPGNKLLIAQKNGIEIMSMNEFMNIVENIF